MKSTLIFNELTCVDHAYIDSEGRIVGGSFMLNVILTGSVQAGEEVVIDFSKGKKQIKAVIDDHATGFDHKLWIMNDSPAVLSFAEAGNTTVETNCVKLQLADDAIRRVDGTYFDLKSIEQAFSSHLEEALNRDGEATKYSVICRLSPVPVAHNGSQYAFRYAHGLPHSSSYGCQNIAHGHLSYFMLMDENYHPVKHTEVPYKELLNIAMELDNTYFYHKGNYRGKSVELDTGVIHVGYESQRGAFAASFVEGTHKLVELETDTTIEHLIEYMKPKFQQFKGIAKYLMVSEGLAKGAIVEL